MNTTTIDITSGKPVNITPMTPEEAMECDAAIHQHLDSADKHLDSAGALLLDMKRRQGWKALNFGTWTEYLESRAVGGKSRRRALELLQAEEVRENLAMCGIPHIEIPAVISQLTTLAKLPPSQQPEALLKADQLAQAEGNKLSANHIAQAVQEIKRSQKKTRTEALSANSASLEKDTQMEEQQHDVVDVVDDAPDAPASTDQSQQELLGKAGSPPPSVDINTKDICTTLLLHVQHLTDAEIAAVFRAVAHHIGAETLSNLVIESIYQDKVADLCNKCLAYMDSRAFSWLEVEKINFSALNDSALKLLIKESKRALNSRHHPEYFLVKKTTTFDPKYSSPRPAAIA